MDPTRDTYTILKEYKDHLCHIRLRSDHILQVNTTTDVEYGRDEALHIISCIQAITGNQAYHVLIVSGEYASVTLDSMQVLATPAAMSYALAKAYVINSLSQKLMANYYLTALKPGKPVRFFQDVEEAEQWLRSLLTSGTH